jgi:hypothetical protein
MAPSFPFFLDEEFDKPYLSHFNQRVAHHVPVESPEFPEFST